MKTKIPLSPLSSIKCPPPPLSNYEEKEKKCAKYYMMHVTLRKVYSPLISFKCPHQYLSLTKKKGKRTLSFCVPLSYYAT